MTKRRPPKNRQPWPAFYIVTAALAGTAVVASLLLDYINMRKGEPAFIFAGGPQAPAAEVPAAKPAPGPPEKVPPAVPSAGAAEAEPAAKRVRRGQVALIMDDIGNSLEVLDELIALGRQVTVSVLPYAPYAAESARLAHDNGLEVLLHLPLESVNNHESLGSVEGLILAGMTEPDIVRSFEASLGRVPFAAGVNNHMGSRFTAERDLVRTILRPIKESGLFFVDSRTTAETVAYDEARKMGVPAVERDVFLDADEDRGRIRGRLIELLQKARKKGRAVGICHPFPETLAVLKSSLFLFDSYSLDAVPVSRLAK